MGQSSPLLSLKNISKEFYGNVVLSDVNFDLAEGEILGLVGENGAGKTTLMHILFGMPVIADTGGFKGEILIEGKPVHFSSPFDALDAGIGMVHQEFSLIPGFTTAENIVLNRESMRPGLLNDAFGYRMSTLDRVDMKKRAEKAIAKLGVRLDADMLISEMPVGHKQFTEIAREISRANTKLLVLDEPTAVLTESEAEVLLASLKKLSKEGVAIIFISHRLQEVVSIADRVVVLRDGLAVKNVPAGGVTIKARPPAARRALKPASPSSPWKISGSTCPAKPSATSPSRSPKARSSASAGWPARASSESPTASWASTRRAAPSPSTANPSRSTTPAKHSRRAWPSCPKIGAA